MLTDVKKALRITVNDFDDEVQGLIDAAKADLQLAGVAAISDADPLIKRAIITYCKAYFGYDNPDADRLAKCYEMLKAHLSLATDYKAVVDSEA